jgi:hypothetical protein
MLGPADQLYPKPPPEEPPRAAPLSSDDLDLVSLAVSISPPLARFRSASSHSPSLVVNLMSLFMCNTHCLLLLGILHRWSRAVFSPLLS